MGWRVTTTRIIFTRMNSQKSQIYVQWRPVLSGILYFSWPVCWNAASTESYSASAPTSVAFFAKVKKGLQSKVTKPYGIQASNKSHFGRINSFGLRTQENLRVPFAETVVNVSRLTRKYASTSIIIHHCGKAQ